MARPTEIEPGLFAWALRVIDRWALIGLAVYWPLIAIVTHVPGDTVSSKNLLPGQDKAIHFGMYLVLTLLTVRSRLLGRERSYHASLIFGGALALAYGVLDEYSQPLFGRTFSYVDMAANLMGVLTMFLMLLPRTRGWRPGEPRNKLLTVLRVWAGAFVPAVIFFGAHPQIRLEGYLPFFAELGWTLRLDHSAHFTLGVLFTLCLAFMAPLRRRRPASNTIIVVVGSALLGFFIEKIQSLAGRAYGSDDVYAYQFGVLVALAVWVVAATVIHRPSEAPAHSPDAAFNQRSFWSQLFD